MAKIGIYGGSFNPVHFGHIGLASWLVAHTDLDALWMMVTPNNPLKPKHILADEQTRLCEVQKHINAIADPTIKQKIIASDFEFGLPKPSYTANTLRCLQIAYPSHQFVLIIGEDNLYIFDQWREWEYIASHFEVWVYPRHCKIESHNNPWWKKENIKGVHILSKVPYFDISSSEIRNKNQSNSF